MKYKNYIFIIACFLVFVVLINIITSLGIIKNDDKMTLDRCIINYSSDLRCKDVHKEKYLQELNISKGDIDDESLQKIIEMNKTDSENLKKIMEISKLSDENFRIKSVNEFLSIDKGFTEKFNIYYQSSINNKKNAKQQIEGYIKSIESSKRMRYEFSQEKIKKLFFDRDSVSFIESIKNTG